MRRVPPAVQAAALPPRAVLRRSGRLTALALALGAAAAAPGPMGRGACAAVVEVAPGARGWPAFFAAPQRAGLLASLDLAGPDAIPALSRVLEFAGQEPDNFAAEALPEQVAAIHRAAAQHARLMLNRVERLAGAPGSFDREAVHALRIQSEDLNMLIGLVPEHRLDLERGRAIVAAEFAAGLGAEITDVGTAWADRRDGLAELSLAGPMGDEPAVALGAPDPTIHPKVQSLAISVSPISERHIERGIGRRFSAQAADVSSASHWSWMSEIAARLGAFMARMIRPTWIAAHDVFLPGESIAAHTPDGRTLAVARVDSVLVLQVMSNVPPGPDTSYRLSLPTPEGREVVGHGRADRLFHLDVHHLSLGAPVQFLAASADGRIIVAVGGSKFRVFLEDGSSLRGGPVHAHGVPFESAALSSDGGTLVVYTQAEILIFRRDSHGAGGYVQAGPAIKRFAPGPLRLAISPDGLTFAAGISDEVRIYGSRSRFLRSDRYVEIGSALRHGAVGPMAFTSDGGALVAASGAKVRFYRRTRARFARAGYRYVPFGSDLDNGDVVASLAHTPDGGVLAVGGRARIRVFRATGGARVQVGPDVEPFGPDGSIDHVTISSDGRMLSAAQGGSLRFFRLASSLRERLRNFRPVRHVITETP